MTHSDRVLWLWECWLHDSWILPLEWNRSRQYQFTQLWVWTSWWKSHKKMHWTQNLGVSQHWGVHFRKHLYTTDVTWCKNRMFHYIMEVIICVYIVKNVKGLISQTSWCRSIPPDLFSCMSIHNKINNCHGISILADVSCPWTLMEYPFAFVSLCKVLVQLS